MESKPETPEVSCVIPAYNEEVCLPGTLTSLRDALGQLGLENEIIVVDNNSTDQTASVARQEGALVVFDAINQIAHARNTGGRTAKGRWLIFVDADTEVSVDVLKASLHALRAEQWVGGGAGIRFDRPVGTFARLSSWGWERLSRTLKWAAGSYIFCRREAFEAVGGFDESLFASEEIDFSRRLCRYGRKKGQRFDILHHTVCTSARKLDWFSTSEILGMLVRFALRPGKLRSRHSCRFWYERPDSSSSDTKTRSTR